MFWVVAKVFGIVAWCLGGCQVVAMAEHFSTFLCIIKVFWEVSRGFKIVSRALICSCYAFVFVACALWLKLLSGC